ncbi:tetratricopeptide repeat-containing sensor histidine kinase [Spirosoma endbachense]|uniref:histidine kinase n=1 Tax=Spirosoma endbachense TaxID=2666025 RepID=A0A6P1W2V8_9BACT|nr:histidine kinase dimerization/phosphoacceptor domain -containing protein [Spirosoma endbachense]QHV99385.1 hypothetical protein GJR95_32160 [Spirosoma endbachense]
MKSKKLILILAITIVSAYQGYAQSISPKIDSLRKLLKVSRADTNRVKLLLSISRLYSDLEYSDAGKPDSTLRFSRQAYALSRSLKYARGWARSYITVANGYRQKGNIPQSRRFALRAVDLCNRYGSADDRADAYVALSFTYTIEGEDLNQKIEHYKKIIPLLQQVGDKQKLAGALRYRGDLYQIRDDYTESLRDLKSALTLYKSIGFKRLDQVYDLIGLVSGRTGHYQQAIQYGLLALKTARECNDSSLLGTYYNRVGLVYDALRQFETAKLYFHKALLIAQKHKDKSSELIISLNLVASYYQLSQYGQGITLLKKISKSNLPVDNSSKIFIEVSYLQMYTKTNQVLQARQHCTRLLKLSESLDSSSISWRYIYDAIIPFYLVTKQYKLAQQLLLLDSNYLVIEKPSLSYFSANQLNWFKLDSALADYSSAIRHYRLYRDFKDSLTRQITSKQIKELDLQYRTEEKENNILQLQHQTKIQEAELRTAQLTRNFSISSAILLVLLLGLGFNQYRLKQRSSQILEAKQLVIDQKNQSLEQVLSQKEELLIEKDWMLREIHHRVKNNLQIITSLLDSQAIFLEDRAALSAIRESQNRVQSMALIHQKLYQSDRLSVIPMADYVTEIVDYLIDSFDRQDTVQKQIDITPLELDATLAVPIGLILNEVVTNSLKYAFPNNRPGLISIELKKLAGQHYQLLMVDNGIGLPTDFDPGQSRSLGMSLINGLSHQIDGDLHISQNNGVRFRLNFSLDKMVKESEVS